MSGFVTCTFKDGTDDCAGWSPHSVGAGGHGAYTGVSLLYLSYIWMDYLLKHYY